MTQQRPKSGHEIRAAFLSFFEERGHRRVRSSSLIPSHDPTLLFTNAGMVQFKDVFTGKESRDYLRAVSAQKCVRAGGKHNDLENVGRTARHHTFFEMLGNFSFGDYFKEEAIRYAWDFLVGTLGLPPERLVVTVFEGTPEIPADEEAARIWREVSSLPPERILRLGAADNFWMMGETGPCGPCSEVHWFHGDDVPCAEEEAGRPCAGVACDCDRWMEIWNLVFMQFDRDASGKLTPLPRPSIDTGAGLERLASVLQGKRSNYDCDLLLTIIHEVAKVAGKAYDGASEEERVSMRVIADHARATAFLVSDGVLPSNEGRGYVLRRIMRRAVRHGTLLGLERPFLHEITAKVVDEMADAYPELRENATLVQEVAHNEEEGFRRTLNRGLSLIQSEIEARQGGDRILPGEVVFKLYDTYGFPDDLTRLIAKEQGFQIDEPGFLRLLEEQRNRSSFAGSGEAAVGALYLQLASELGDTEFLGYEGDGLQGRGTVLALLREGERVETATAGEAVEVILDRTPFYGEGGGQVGDSGSLSGPAIDGARGELHVEVQDTQKPAGGLIVHRGVVRSGTLRVGEAVEARVDGARRLAIRANHSATHLLHRVLQEQIGPHVKQAGSVVAPDYLRFDFTHFQAPTREQLAAIEARVNEMIRDNTAVATEVQSLEEARASGAVALFGEKYDERVRVVQVHPASRELCGGTHVERTGDIGLFRIASESSIAAGVRRIVALTGAEALRWTQQRDDELHAAAALFRTAPEELREKIEAAQRKQRELEKELEALRRRLAGSRADELLAGVRKIGDIPLVAARVDGQAKELRELADKMRDKLGSAVVALGGASDGKAILLVAVSQDLVQRGLKAGELIRQMASEIGGRGGGKPDFAQAGGPDPAGVERAFAALERILAQHGG